MADKYRATLRKLLASTAIERRLRATDAVVLERIARGGGATNWYYCSDGKRLATIEERLSPGSLVSFYFDERIAPVTFSSAVSDRVGKIIEDTGDCVVGTLQEDGVGLEVEIVTGPTEFSEFVSSLAPDAVFYFGAFPGADDDGESAVSMVLPDADGVVRKHPH